MVRHGQKFGAPPAEIWYQKARARPGFLRSALLRGGRSGMERCSAQNACANARGLACSCLLGLGRHLVSTKTSTRKSGRKRNAKSYPCLEPKNAQKHAKIVGARCPWELRVCPIDSFRDSTSIGEVSAPNSSKHKSYGHPKLTTCNKKLWDIKKFRIFRAHSRAH